jgi:hypothetical protein
VPDEWSLPVYTLDLPPFPASCIVAVSPKLPISSRMPIITGMTANKGAYLWLPSRDPMSYCTCQTGPPVSNWFQ